MLAEDGSPDFTGAPNREPDVSEARTRPAAPAALADEGVRAPSAPFRLRHGWKPDRKRGPKRERTRALQNAHATFPAKLVTGGTLSAVTFSPGASRAYRPRRTPRLFPAVPRGVAGRVRLGLLGSGRASWVLARHHARSSAFRLAHTRTHQHQPETVVVVTIVGRVVVAVGGQQVVPVVVVERRPAQHTGASAPPATFGPPPKRPPEIGKFFSAASR